MVKCQKSIQNNHLINHCILSLLNLPQSRLPTLPGIGTHHQPVVEAFSPVHAPASTTVCKLEDAFITSFCTGHVAAPNKVPACGCLLSHRPSDFAGECLLKVFSDAWGRSFPLPSSLFGLENIQTSVCIRSLALPGLGSPDLGVDILNR